MILLTVIAVGLLSLSSISLRSSSQSLAMQSARANARVALMLAIGDLQKQLGPDGRISSLAEQRHGASSGNRSQWVGVHDSWDAASGFLKRPTPVFRQWLASGDPLSLSSESLVESPSDSDVLLVGKGTLGDSPAAGQEVRVPELNFTNNRGQLAGKVAWWVSDESMKAALPSGGPRGKDLRDGKSDALLGSLAAERPNAEILKNLMALALPDEEMSKLVSTETFNILAPEARKNFHDVTHLSRGVLADVTRRRLKQDLSLVFLKPRTFVQDVPLYDGAGNINDIAIDASTGKPKNQGVFEKFGSDSDMLKYFATASQPGINLEELWIYSNLYRQLKWAGSVPTLEARSGAEDLAGDFRYSAVSDPSFNYWKPVIASQQYMLSMGAIPSNYDLLMSPTGAAAGKFDMALKIDAVFTVWNPLNMKIIIPPGDFFNFQLSGLPFKVKWDITDAAGGTKRMPAPTTVDFGRTVTQTSTKSASWPYDPNTFPLTRRVDYYDAKVPNLYKPSTTTTLRFGVNDVFRCNLGGATGGKFAKGYTLEAGECAFFGFADKNLAINNSGSTTDYDMDRGWGGDRSVKLNGNIGAYWLDASDIVNFSITADDKNPPSTAKPSYFTQYIGARLDSAGKGGLQLGSTGVATNSITNPDSLYFPEIKNSQSLSVGQFATYKPFMIFGNYLNAESSDGTTNSHPSWPRVMANSAVIEHLFNDASVAKQHEDQQIWRIDQLPYDTTNLISITANNRGFFGGGHSPDNGVNLMATRQISPVPPVSLMSLSHAIANGFSDRFSQSADRSRYPSSNNPLSDLLISGMDTYNAKSVAFTGQSYLYPQVERAIGNSMASPFLATSQSIGTDTGVHFGLGTALTVPVVDHSYLANLALFDSWFFSSVSDSALLPATASFKSGNSPKQMLQNFFEDGDQRLANPRFVPSMAWADAEKLLVSGSDLHPEAAARISACLLNDGAFNINSTHVDAWKSLLASNRGGSKLVAGNSRNDKELTPTGGSGLAAAGAAPSTSSLTEPNQWSGYRALSDDEITSLAKEIVTQVKARGPFISVADFLNRNPSSGDSKQRNMGAVQAAIELAGVNDKSSSGSRSTSPSDFDGMPGADAASGVTGSTSRAVGIPGYLMQSDLLTPVASQLQARGDTFRIRAHGSTTGADGKVIAEAWCEAVVQRTPSWVDSADAAQVAETDLTVPSNKIFGRRFETVSFRWLARNEI